MDIKKKYRCRIDFEGDMDEVIIAIGSFEYDTATEAERAEDEEIFYYSDDEADFATIKMEGHCDGWRITEVLGEVD